MFKDSASRAKADSEFQMPEPVFRSSPGKDVMSTKQRETAQQAEQKERAELLEWTLARLEFATSEQQIKDILNDYNQEVGVKENKDGFMLTEIIKQVSIGDKIYNIHKSQLESGGLSVLPDHLENAKQHPERIWQKLKEDQKLVNILSYMTSGQLFNTEMMSVSKVKDFYKLYPTEEEYMQNERIGLMLEELKEQTDMETYRAYYAKAIEFVDTMYPED